MKNRFVFFKISTLINFICSAFLLPAMYSAILYKDHDYLFYKTIEPGFVAIVFYLNFLLFILSGFNLFLIFNSFLNDEKRSVTMIFGILFAINFIAFFGQIIYVLFMNTPIDIME